MTNRKEFSGEGFSKEPFTPEELAQHRDRAHFFDHNFKTPQQIIEALGITRLVMIGRAIPGFLLVGSLIGVWQLGRVVGVW